MEPKFTRYLIHFLPVQDESHVHLEQAKQAHAKHF
jgi:hypothetical protein